MSPKEPELVGIPTLGRNDYETVILYQTLLPALELIRNETDPAERRAIRVDAVHDLTFAELVNATEDARRSIRNRAPGAAAAEIRRIAGAVDVLTRQLRELPDTPSAFADDFLSSHTWLPPVAQRLWSEIESWLDEQGVTPELALRQPEGADDARDVLHELSQLDRAWRGWRSNRPHREAEVDHQRAAREPLFPQLATAIARVTEYGDTVLARPGQGNRRQGTPAVASLPTPRRLPTPPQPAPPPPLSFPRHRMVDTQLGRAGPYGRRFTRVHQVHELTLTELACASADAARLVSEGNHHQATTELAGIATGLDVLTGTMAELHAFPGLSFHELRRNLGNGAGSESPGVAEFVARTTAANKVWPGAADAPNPLAIAIRQVNQGWRTWLSSHVNVVDTVVGPGSTGTGGMPIGDLVHAFRGDLLRLPRR